MSKQKMETSLNPRRRVFISYSHKDSDHLERLHIHLEPYVREGIVDIWDDTKIEPGSNWREEIKQTIALAKVAILLVSADFLASEFIAKNELPPLLAAAKQEGATILPVILSPCVFDDTKLAQFQTVNVPSRPLSSMNRGKREGVWVKVAKLIKKILEPQLLDSVSDELAQLADELSLKVNKSEATPQSQASRNKEDNDLLAKPSHIFSLPYLRNLYFTGREDILKRLRETLLSGKATALTQRQAISGLGGVGKTQIAIEYAYRYRDVYQGVFWVHAATHQDIIASFLKFAEPLQLSKRGEQDMILAAVQQWFITHDKWLLIFDNADDLTLVEEFFPTNERGYILLTTRDQAPGMLAISQTVETFDTDTGMLLLLRRARVVPSDASLDQAKPIDRRQAERIVKMMEGLPLAIDQAAAYIDETGCSLTSYLKQYQQQQAKFLQWRGRSSKDHPLPVATTWSLSFAQAEQRNPAAADLLRVCAFLAADVIPEELLKEGASALGPRLAGQLSQLTQLDEIIAVLRQFSLIRRSPKAYELSIHRLVQAVLQLDMDEQTQKTWAERVICAVSQTITSVERGYSKVGEYLFDSYYIELMREYLLPHALQCAQLIEKYTLKLPEGPQLLTQTGFYLRKRARYAEAEPLLNQALSITEQTFGPHHSLTVLGLDNIARLYLDWEKYTEAEQFLKRALAIREQVTGFTSLQSAMCFNNLAYIYYKQGKYTEAEQNYQNSLSIKAQVHPHGYFRAYIRQKHKALHRITKDELSSLLNTPGHETYRVYYAVAACVLDNEMPCELIGSTARSLISSLVAARVINNELPTPFRNFSTSPFSGMHDLMCLLLLYTTAARVINNELPLSPDDLLNIAPDLDASYALLTSIIYHIIGHGIPHYFFSFVLGLNNLATFYHSQGEDTNAELFYTQAVTIYDLVLPHYNNLVLARGYRNAAAFYKNQGKHDEAAHCYFYVFAISHRVRSFEHPETAMSLNDLIEIHENYGKYVEAEELYQRYFGFEYFGPRYSWFDESHHKMHALQRVYERLRQKTNIASHSTPQGSESTLASQKAHSQQNPNSIKLDDSLLEELGLGSLSAEDKISLLKHIYETLESRVGQRLMKQMTNQQFIVFERFFAAGDDEGAFHWLETNFPNYRATVADEYSRLKAETSHIHSISASQKAHAHSQQNPNSIKLDDSLLEELGLGSLSAEDKISLLKHIYETLESRVGWRLAKQMTNQQLDEFERFFAAGDDEGAFRWLETNFPNYRATVADEYSRLKAEVGSSTADILVVANTTPSTFRNSIAHLWRTNG